MKRTIIILLALTATSCVGRRGAKGGGNEADSLAATGIAYPFTIDFSKDYPMEPLSLQEALGEMEYVALETTPECLIADLPGLQSPVVTDDDIIIRSGTTIFRFGRDGKFRNKIGYEGRGPGEFLSATQMCVDGSTPEVFVYDILGKNILVYGFDGRHRRTLRAASNTIVDDMAPVTDSTLLIANSTNDSKKSHIIQPFQIVSSRDGSVIRSPIAPYENPHAYVAAVDAEALRNRSDEPGDPTVGFKGGGTRMMILMNDGNPTTQIFDANNIYATRAGTMIANFVADTVWMASPAGELTPRWIKTPSPAGIPIDNRRWAGFRGETDRYAFFQTSGGMTGNNGFKVDKQNGTVTRTYLYDANLDHERTPGNRIIAPRVNTGRFAMPYQPFQLLAWLEEGKLSGELATLAATLKEDDNPVLMIQKNR